MNFYYHCAAAEPASPLAGGVVVLLSYHIAPEVRTLGIRGGACDSVRAIRSCDFSTRPSFYAPDIRSLPQMGYYHSLRRAARAAPQNSIPSSLPTGDPD
jgi:hypothetical protein